MIIITSLGNIEVDDVYLPEDPIENLDVELSFNDFEEED